VTTNLHNPFIVGAPLTSPDGYGFYGRRKIFADLKQNLNAKHRPAMLLFGHRRIGKTSVLHQMHRHMPNEWRLVFFDSQGRTNDDLDTFLYGLAYDISKTLKLGKISRREATAENFRDAFFQRALDSLDNDKRRLVLLFDEFDVFYSPMPVHTHIREPARTDIIHYVRKMIEDEQEVGYIFVVGRRPEHLPAISRELASLNYHVGRLSEEETRLLLLQLSSKDLSFSDGAISRIWELTSGHPLATQLMGFVLWNRWIQRGSVPLQAVDEAVEEALQTGDTQFYQIYDTLATPGHRLFLSALADVSDTGDWTPLSSVLNELRSRHVDITHNVNLICIDLRNWDIISAQGSSFRFSVDLVRRWILKNRSLTRMKSEPPLVSEAAYRLFQAGEDIRSDSAANESTHLKNLQTAIDNYRHALQINPLLIEARMGLARTLLERGEVEEALKVSEDSDLTDPALREAFRQILLEVGMREEHEGRLDGALDFFNRALDLGEDARSRRCRNRVLIAQGDRLLQENGFLEAIEKFEEASATERVRQANELLQIARDGLEERVHEHIGLGLWEEAELILQEGVLPMDDPLVIALREEVEEGLRAWRIEQGQTHLQRGELEIALALFKKASHSQMVSELNQMLLKKRLEELVAQRQWQAAADLLDEASTDGDEGDTKSIALWRDTDGWFTRLHTRLLREIESLEKAAKPQEALGVFEVYWRLVPAREVTELGERLRRGRESELLAHARKLAREGDHEGVFDLLDGTESPGLVRSLFVREQWRKWAQRIGGRLALATVFIPTAYGALAYQEELRSFVSPWLLAAFTIWVGSVSIHLLIWFFLGDLILDPLFLFNTWYLYSKHPNADSRNFSERMVKLFYRGVSRSAVYSHPLAWGVAFFFIDSYCRSLIMDRPDLLDLGLAFLLGVVVGICIGDASEERCGSSRGVKSLLVNLQISSSFLFVVVLAVYAIPILVRLHWGRFDSIHYIAWTIAMIAFGIPSFVIMMDSIER